MMRNVRITEIAVPELLDDFPQQLLLVLGQAGGEAGCNICENEPLPAATASSVIFLGGTSLFVVVAVIIVSSSGDKLDGKATMSAKSISTSSSSVW